MGVSRQRATGAGGIYDVLHAVNKMYDSGNDDDGDGDDAAREGESAGGRDHDEEPERKPRNSINTRADGRTRTTDGRNAPLRISIVRLGVDRRPGPYVSEATAR